MLWGKIGGRLQTRRRLRCAGTKTSTPGETIANRGLNDLRDDDKIGPNFLQEISISVDNASSQEEQLGTSSNLSKQTDIGSPSPGRECSGRVGRQLGPASRLIAALTSTGALAGKDPARRSFTVERWSIECRLGGKITTPACRRHVTRAAAPRAGFADPSSSGSPRKGDRFRPSWPTAPRAPCPSPYARELLICPP